MKEDLIVYSVIVSSLVGLLWVRRLSPQKKPFPLSMIIAWGLAVIPVMVTSPYLILGGYFLFGFSSSVDGAVVWSRLIYGIFGAIALIAILFLLYARLAVSDPEQRRIPRNTGVVLLTWSVLPLIINFILWYYYLKKA